MILTRSPYYLNRVFENDFNDRVEFLTRTGIREGSNISIIDSTILTKQKVSDTQTNSFADISNIIRSFYQHSPIVLSELQSNQIFNSRDGEVLYSANTGSEFDTLGNEFTFNTIIDIATDGYGYFTEGQNFDPQQKILLSHSNYKMDSRGYFIVPFREDTESEVLTLNSVPVDTGTNQSIFDRFKYLIINGNDYTTDITVNFDGEEIYIERVEECKYDVNEIQFLNRFGMLESMHFYKALKESISSDSQSFENSYTNGTSYDTLSHQKQRYNKMLNVTKRIETGFLNQDYNLTIKELMASEKVWLRQGNLTIPVNVKTNSLEIKTGIVDKLISYSIEFEHAFDELNNV